MKLVRWLPVSLTGADRKGLIMTRISHVLRNPILVSEGLCLFWYIEFNGISTDPWKNIPEITTTANTERYQLRDDMWTSNEPSADAHEFNLLPWIPYVRIREVFSLVVSFEYTEECQTLSFISIWADTIRQMLYYEISSDWLGLQLFPESWGCKVIKNNYYSSDGAQKKVQAIGETRYSGWACASAPRSLLR